ncbi:LytTR family DNA-binding domain-containing protein [Paenibacillus sp. UMB4589-SE434]|uniref:LytTR family DNA-binding domain-containing protein n=1 Tax=Paenibacillus sp. UMB4589-SE434 TaxID=3046314 RepID=UPI00254C9969|nr:LytTR family DNA-binding domain-containing protein [Paenibacillus sp. UMB4589-SE434]MDK8182144.1 LytTR family DNA-binding domain-containing protein [Paenibacillus sp. UMB4589-SE434]
MKQLTVTCDLEGDMGISNIPLEDIVYLEFSKVSTKDKVIAHTEESKFYMPGTLKYWTHVFNASGLRYRTVDRSFAINVDKVISIDNVFLTAYFEVKRCTMSRRMYEDLVSEFPHLTIGIESRRPV